MQIVAPGGQVIRPPDVAAGPPVDATARQIAASGMGHAYSDATVSGTHVRVLTQGIGPRGAVQVARSLEEVDSVLSDQLLLLVLVGAGGILLAAVLSIVVARTALRPIALFTRRTESLTAHPDPSQRLEVSGRDEIARLAQSFNTTLDALEQSVEAQRNLVADASHELRTPIATLRANIQLLRDADRLSPEEQRSLRDDIITELDELTALVADVVELARGTKATGEPDDVRLDAIVGDVVQRTRRRATRPQLRRRARADADRGRAGARGPRGHQPARQRAQVEPARRQRRGAAGRRRAQRARPRGRLLAGGPAPCLRSLLPRAAGARAPGSGLGLAIVRQAAEAHGGWARASNAEGGGALLRVSFGNSTSELTPGEVGASLS